MIYITHPLEGEDDRTFNLRKQYGEFLTAKIQYYLPEWPIFNFPLNYLLFYQEMGESKSKQETLSKAFEFIAKSDAGIVINFPGQELCERTQCERRVFLRLDIPMIELPFAQHRAEQLIKQDALSADQKRCLNLLRSNLIASQEV